ncbi:uncharacterized protein F5147DRAFT_660145 [Suillus discolor]|uniref:Uncharacterized protein n=1 Tax=Suillus discolor TaxID=1912936 RepID=A0A9P7JL77_9AGAM|nr:uncharacterized protein F5147DRAFT_660145 [Suillus discolor]KAG2083548.1 hypothetical protein F5147DRAFT_660145 [Suillus discolor]
MLSEEIEPSLEESEIPVIGKRREGGGGEVVEKFEILESSEVSSHTSMLTHSTEQDIELSGVTNLSWLKACLGIHNPLCLMQSFNRPNLYYVVQPKPSMKKKVVQAITGFIKSQHATHTSIVYGFLKLECEELAEQHDYDLSAKYYRASMGSPECSTTQDPLSTQLEARGVAASWKAARRFM